MDLTTLESLIGELISVNEQILDRLDDIRSELSEVRMEVDWSEESSSAKQILERLDSIESHTFSTSLNTT